MRLVISWLRPVPVPVILFIAGLGGLATAESTAPRPESLDLGGTVAMKLVPIPAGRFLMGCPATEKDKEHGHAGNEAQHEVVITRPFHLGATEVTQQQFEAVMGRNPSTFRGPNLPVDQVAWADAADFCQKVSYRTSRIVRLPTEAEWEYACRAGAVTRFSFGEDDTELGAYAWYIANSWEPKKRVRMTHPVGLKKPNAWGLYDMHGNAWEWCSDWYAADYGGGPYSDPTGPASGTFHVMRGGSWTYCSWGCRLSGRGRVGPDGKYDVNGGGFRVVLAGKE